MPNLTNNINAQEQGTTTSHAKKKLFDKHRGKIKSNQKFYNIFKVYRSYMKILYKTQTCTNYPRF